MIRKNAARPLLIALGLVAFGHVPAVAVTPLDASRTIEGTILDAQSGLPVAGASVRNVAGLEVTSDQGGRFSIRTTAGRAQTLRVERVGYQPVDTAPIDLSAPAAEPTEHVTISVQRTTSAGVLKVVGSTTVRAGESLQRAGTIYRSLSTEILAASGKYRAGDALRELPGVNNFITGDTAALGDDLQLNLRGLGTLETTATLDGHPIGFGIPGGYNYQLSPIFGLRDVSVTYGSGGSGLFGVDAIGGVIDFQTLEPSVTPRLRLSQGYGTFDRTGTIVQATGKRGRFGYALAAGVSGLDGPLKNSFIYQPGAAYDQSATSAAVRGLAVYKDDSSAVARGALTKFRYALSPAIQATLTTMASSYWNDKTGNGDGDYLTPAGALAIGDGLLSTKAPADPCPAGTFTATNANGAPNGTGPGGAADGGTRCQTPQQYAGFNRGYAGAGPAWQSFNSNDQALRVESLTARQNVRFDAYTNRYRNTIDRTFALPFVAQPGDSPSSFNYIAQVRGSGATLSDRFIGRAAETTIGASYVNLAYDLRFNGAQTSAPIVHESAYFLRSAFHPERSPLTLFTDAYFKHSTVTNTSYVDPRISLVYVAGRSDVVRLAAGANTTQPSADLLNQPFVAQMPGGAGGGAPITCTGLNSIGTAPSSLLRPERGVDEEFSLGHRFQGDTQVQLTLYNANIYDKMYQTTESLDTVGAGFIDPAFIQAAALRVAGVCGNQNPRALLGVAGTLNVGHLRARGAMLNGRVRLNARTFIDYDWALTSTVLRSIPAALLQAQKTLVPDSQYPRLPLHTFDASYDRLIGRALEARYTIHSVSANNTKSLPAYNYSELRLSVSQGRGVFGVTVTNLFNQNADIRGLRNEGVPLALNAYASAADYAPLTGANATERFGLPYRQIFFSYDLQIR